jgi:hypothetical protein
MRKYIFILMPLFLLRLQLFGQDETGKTPQSAGHYIYLGEGDELLMNVQIWGQVKNPGLYSLPEQSDMATLVSLAGGPTEHADLSAIKIIRKGMERDSLFTVNLKKAMLGGEKEKTMLRPGDIVEIMPSKFYSFSTFVRFITQVTMVAAIYYQIFGQ